MQIILNNLNISKKENLYKNIFYTINTLYAFNNSSNKYVLQEHLEAVASTRLKKNLFKEFRKHRK